MLQEYFSWRHQLPRWTNDLEQCLQIYILSVSTLFLDLVVTLAGFSSQYILSWHHQWPRTLNCLWQNLHEKISVPFVLLGWFLSAVLSPLVTWLFTPQCIFSCFASFAISENCFKQNLQFLPVWGAASCFCKLVRYTKGLEQKRHAYLACFVLSFSCFKLMGSVRFVSHISVVSYFSSLWILSVGMSTVEGVSLTVGTPSALLQLFSPAEYWSLTSTAAHSSQFLY